MDIKNVEEAKKVLEDDLANNPHILSAPMGHGVTYRKIRSYLFACILAGIPKADCVDWLYSLYKEQTDEQKNLFQLIIDSIANALYDFNDFLNKQNKK